MTKGKRSLSMKIGLVQ